MNSTSRRQRKTRLDKREASEFVGFAAYAATSESLSSLTASESLATTVSRGWSPVYVGNNPNSQQLFLILTKIGQKRDAATKVKAMQDFQQLVLTSNDTNTNVTSFDDVSSSALNGISKKDQVQAFAHFAFLFHSKLYYDNVSSVRAEGLTCLGLFIQFFPKAWMTLTGRLATQSSAPPRQQSTSTALELWGIIWSAQNDPAYEVQSAAKRIMQGWITSGSKVCDSDRKPYPKLEDISRGVWGFGLRILSYGQPIIMHQALFAVTSKTQTGKKSESSTETSAVTDSEKDQLEERFERVVGAVLSGLNEILRDPAFTSMAADELQQPATISTLCKVLFSSKASLRRKTYALLSMFCQTLPTIFFGGSYDSCTRNQSSTSPSFFSLQLLIQSFASEKDSTNISSLLEFCLLYLAQKLKYEVSVESQNREGIEPLVRCLSKVFKTACYGATARTWGPTLLPLLSLVPFEEQRVVLLSSAWSGYEAASLADDKLSILTTVSECSAFLLIQPIINSFDEMENKTGKHGTGVDCNGGYAEDLASLWLKALSFYLASSSNTTFTMDSEALLPRNLARDMSKLLVTCRRSEPNHNVSVVQLIADRFSTCLQTTLESAAAKIEHLAPLTRLLLAVAQQRQQSTLPTPSQGKNEDAWHSILLPLFAKSVSVSSAVSTDLDDENQPFVVVPPNLESLELIEVILRCCLAFGCSPFLGSSIGRDDDGERFDFIRKKALKWLLVHVTTDTANSTAATLATRGEILSLCVERDFRLLRACFPFYSLVEQKELMELIWESLFSASSKCDLEILAKGVSILYEEISAQVIMCKPFEDFLIQLGRNLVNFSDHSTLLDSGKAVVAHKADVLLDSVALVGIGPCVMDAWMEAACPERNPIAALKEFQIDPILNSLAVIARGRGRLSTANAARVVLECWRRGHELWSSQCLALLIEDAAICQAVMDAASTEMRDLLYEICFTCQLVDNIFSQIVVWSERAVRLIDIATDVGLTHGNTSVPSVKLVGLGDVNFWETTCSHGDSKPLMVLYQCLINTLVAFDDTRERFSLLRDFGDEELGTVRLLFVLATAGCGMPCELSAQREDCCARLLSALGGSRLGLKVLEGLIRDAINRLAFLLSTEGPNSKMVFRGVAVISQLLDLALEGSFSLCRKDCSEELDSSCIKEGDEVWYIPSMEVDAKRERASVVKVHSDDFPRLYFTISLNGDNNTKVERQTVGDRLRRHDVFRNCQASRFGNILELQDRVSDQIYRDLIMPYLNVDTPVAALAELINVLISQTGLDRTVGVGSTHFDVLSLVRSFESRLVNCLKVSPTESQGLAVSLSAAMGFGDSTPSFLSSFDVLRINPDASIREIVRLYDKGKTGDSMDQDRALLRWLSVSVTSKDIHDFQRQVVGLIFSISYRIMVSCACEEFSDDCLLVLKALHRAIQTVHSNSKGILGLATTEVRTIQSLFSLFGRGWNSIVNLSGDGECAQYALTWKGVPLWKPYVSSLVALLLESNKEELRRACQGCCNELIGALQDAEKQAIAMRLLDNVFAHAEPMYDTVSEEPATLASQILNSKVEIWKRNLVHDEVEELEEEIQVIRSWVPDRLANEVCRTGLFVTVEDDENNQQSGVITIGLALSWLLLLRLAESSASKNIRNRLAFSSFVDKCGAVAAMLNFSLHHIQFNKKDSQKARFWEDALLAQDSMDKSFSVSQLAQVLLFRTVEVFPTLSKRWYEENCPKHLLQSVNDFTTLYIAPEIFRRELDRIKDNSAAFGSNMVVTGSLVTRQVTATYTQDDFHLRVSVELPLCFPFRSAEVDCSQTFGIPEKRWKRWELQIRLMLNSQDGTIQDALTLWRENVDQEFTGVEPCLVCYSVLSVKKHELPNLECRTCHNRFHSSCLKQWFLSSGKSQCVLCQQPWSGTRIQ